MVSNYVLVTKLLFHLGSGEEEEEEEEGSSVRKGDYNEDYNGGDTRLSEK